MKHKLKIYNSKTYPMTDEDRKRFEKNLEKERRKFERDSKCGGIDDAGVYIALHHRWEE